MIGVVLLPQLLFFWLAPQDAAARWAVYIVGTVLTFLLTCMSFGVCWYVGVRRGAAMAAVSGVFDAAVVGVCAALLASDASVRTALFSLGALVLLYIICAAPLTTGLEEQEPGEPRPAPDPAEHFQSDMNGLMEELFDTVTKSVSVPLDRLTQAERTQIIAKLYDQGMFELRGAVQFTVHKLACSQASIYRYIKKVKSQTE